MMIKKAVLILLVFSLNSFLSFSQKAVPSIQMASNSLNTEHPFYDVLLKKEAKYIDWLYFHCKGLSDKNLLKPPMNDPLVFTIKQAGTERLDTISNCVHPKLYEDEREPEWKSEIPLYGSFPKDINFHLKNDPNSAATIDLIIQRETANIKIEVLTEEGDLVSIIIDKTLKKGSHRFNWSTTEIKAGNYFVFTEIDTRLTIHKVSIDKNWWANLFSSDSEVTTAKIVSSTGYETLDIPKLKEEMQYIHKNRFGTSVGINLLTAAMVHIKLYAINGDYITTIHDQKLAAGETEFLLDKHVEKSGWYFVHLSVNEKRKHLKLKIKK